MNVAIIGGTGFVGGYLVEALLAAGHDVAALVRPGSEAKLRHADRCRQVPGDLGSEAAIGAVLEGAVAVIYNVGLLREFPRQGITFEECHYRGVVRTIDAARAASASRFLLMSANGVKPDGTAYQSTKIRAEQELKASGLEYTIFRPSVIFGDPRGQLEIATQLHRDMIRPPLPAVGFHTGWNPTAGAVLMSPVHVRDVADAFVAALGDGATIGKTYELGGPEALAWTEMLERIAAAVGRRKWIVPMPVAVMRLAATLFDWLPFFPATRDQLTMLAEGNSARPAALEALIRREPLGFTPETLAYLHA